MRELFRKFAETTSMKGVPRILKAKSMAIRVLWILAVLGLLSVSSYMAYNLIGQFLLKPKAIKIVDINGFGEAYSDYSELFTVPDVTVCNQNSLTAYNTYPNITSWYEYIINALYVMSETEVDGATFGKYTSPRGYLEFVGPSVIAEDKSTYDFIIDCTFGFNFDGQRYPCGDAVIMSHYPSVFYSQCYRVGLNRTYFPDMRPIRLSLTLYLDEVNAPLLGAMGTEVLATAGAVVMVNEDGELPVIESAVQVPAGHFTTLNVKKMLHQRINDEYSPCRDEDDEEMTIQDVKGNAYVYTQIGCFNQEMQEAVHKQCGCLNSNYGSMPVNASLDDVKFCAIGDLNFTKTEQEGKCLASAVYGNLDHVTKVCIPTCEEITHSSTVSSSPWPSPAAQLAFFETYIRWKPWSWRFYEYEEIVHNHYVMFDNEATLRAFRQLSLIQENFAKVEIINPGISSVKFESKYQMTVSSLLASLGGNLNLWSGISTIIIIEVIDLCVKLIQSTTERKVHTTQVTSINKVHY